MKIKNKSINKEYDYPNDVLETVKIGRRIRDDFKKFCKEKKIIKSKLVEKFYKEILVAFKSGELNSSNANLSIDILRGTVRESK